MTTRSLFVEVALPISIALDETFDYLVPAEMEKGIRPGLRVRVPLRNRTLTGYVMTVKKTSPFRKKCKSVIRLIDKEPLLDDSLWDLARAMRDTYACGLADVLNTFLPLGVRSDTRSRDNGTPPEAAIPQHAPLTVEERQALQKIPPGPAVIVLADPFGKQRWPVYAGLIKETLDRRKSVILTVAQHDGIVAALERLGGVSAPFILSSYRKRAELRQAWSAARNAPFCFVTGTRSAVFAPVKELGLIIVDEDSHNAHHQDQAPCYRTSDIALGRIRAAGGRCVLGSILPSLGNAHLCREGGAVCVTLEGHDLQPQITLMDLTRAPDFQDRRTGLSRPITHRLSLALQEKETALIITHQKCFVSALYCRRCRKAVTCPRCSVPLKEHHKEKTLRCAVCGHTDPVPELCPTCRRSYVRRIGFGSEKTYEQLRTLFPAARIRTAESGLPPDDGYDIILATPGQLGTAVFETLRCDRVFVLDADQPLAAADYRAAERTFNELWKLRLFVRKEMCLQTRWPGHYVFDFLGRQDPAGFARRETEERRELAWPPVRPLASLTVRSASQKNAFSEATRCSKALKKGAAGQGIEVFEPAEARPFKVRGNYRYQVFIRSENPDAVRRIVRRLMKKGANRVYLVFDPKGGETA